MKKFNIFWLIISLCLITTLIYNFHDVMLNPGEQFKWDISELSGYVVETWDIETWNITNIDTWFLYSWWNTSIEASNFDKYISYVDKWNNLTFYPPKQPYQKSEWYTSDSEVLNKYLAKNTFYIDISRYSGLKNWWYLYIKTKDNPIDWIFMYWHNSYWKCGKPVSWKLVQSDKYKISDTEFLYPLDSIEIIAYYSKKNCIFNWQEQINSRKNQYIWWYIASTKWNTIEEISIAWE